MTQDRRVAVIGLGYVGLPLAIAFSEAGLEVEGIDACPAASPSSWPGPPRSTTSPTSASARRWIAACASFAGRLDDVRGGRDLRVRPTPITDQGPGPAPVLSAAETICGHIRAGQLIVLQSTTFPGTTTGPFAEVVERSGLKAGVDLDLAFAPSG